MANGLDKDNRGNIFSLFVLSGLNHIGPIHDDKYIGSRKTDQLWVCLKLRKIPDSYWTGDRGICPLQLFWLICLMKPLFQSWENARKDVLDVMENKTQPGSEQLGSHHPWLAGSQLPLFLWDPVFCLEIIDTQTFRKFYDDHLETYIPMERIIQQAHVYYCLYLIAVSIFLYLYICNTHMCMCVCV